MAAHGLAKLDLREPADATRALDVENFLLSVFTGGIRFGFIGPANNEQQHAANELARQRWFSVLHHVGDRASFWELNLAFAPGRREDVLQDSFWHPVFSEESSGSGPADGKAQKILFGKTQVQKQVGSALAWMAAQQDEDGAFRLSADTSCDTELPAQENELGRTALCLLAFIRAGNTLEHGPYASNVVAAVRFLLRYQDERGLFLNRREALNEQGQSFIQPLFGQGQAYEQAIATLALCELLAEDDLPLLRGSVAQAIDAIKRGRNLYGAWRYEVPPTGQNDTSVSGWNLYALYSAEMHGFRVDPEHYAGGLSWIDEVTEIGSGRVGYDAPGAESSRVSFNSSFPTEHGEAMTAMALRVRNLLQPADHEVKLKHLLLIQSKPPVWGPQSCDMYYWYHGKLALGSDCQWSKDLLKVLIKNQVQVGNCTGSWDPIGPWGMVGGRLYSTALCTLCLLPPGSEAPYQMTDRQLKRHR